MNVCAKHQKLFIEQRNRIPAWKYIYKMAFIPFIKRNHFISSKINSSLDRKRERAQFNWQRLKQQTRKKIQLVFVRERNFAWLASAQSSWRLLNQTLTLSLSLPNRPEVHSFTHKIQDGLFSLVSSESFFIWWTPEWLQQAQWPSLFQLTRISHPCERSFRTFYLHWWKTFPSELFHWWESKTKLGA